MADPADILKQTRSREQRKWSFGLPRLVAAVVAAGCCFVVAHPFGRWAHIGAAVTGAGFAGIALTVTRRDIIPALRLAYGMVVGGILGGACPIFFSDGISRRPQTPLLPVVIGIMIGAYIALNPFREEDKSQGPLAHGLAAARQVLKRPARWSFSSWRLAIVLVWNCCLIPLVVLSGPFDRTYPSPRIAEILAFATVLTTIVMIPFSALILYVPREEYGRGSEQARAAVLALGALVGALVYGSIFAMLRGDDDASPLHNFYEFLVGCFFGGTGGILIGLFAWQRWCRKQKTA